GAITSRDSVAPDPSFFQMRCIDGQNVAFPLSRGKSLGGVERIFRRMRTAIHPDSAFRSPCEMMRVNRNELLRVRVPLFPDQHSAKARNVIRRVYAALIFRKRDERRIPRVCSKTRGIVQRNSGVVPKLGTEETIRPILMQDRNVVPNAREVYLAESNAG